MKLLYWDCRGFSRPTAVRYLREVTRRHLPDMICLAETKVMGVRQKMLQLGFEDFFEVPPEGRRGGLTVAWKRGVLLDISSCNAHFVVKSDPPYQCWLLSFVYGPSLWNEKESFWYDLGVTGREFQGPWVCLGDFNAVTHQNDKYGGRSVTFSSSSAGMNRFMLSARLLDLGFSGNKFTWTNGREDQSLIMERLDRGIANGEWRSLFPIATVSHFPRLASDHAPILLNTYGDQDRNPRPFRFESFWVEDKRCSEVVEKAWRQNVRGSPAFSLCHRLKATEVALRRWNKEVFGNIQERIRRLQAELDMVQQAPINSGMLLRERELSTLLLEAQRKVEELWRQKARITWLKTPDLNTSFFHLSTIIRRRRNGIDALLDTQGRWLHNCEEIGSHIVDYFTRLFSATPSHFPHGLDDLSPKVITAEDNTRLQRIPDETEV